MIFNTHYDFANNFTLINVANVPNFNGHGPQTTKHSPAFVGAICGTCRGVCLIILQIIKIFAIFCKIPLPC